MDALVVLPWKLHMQQLAYHSLRNTEQYPHNAGMGNCSNKITAHPNQGNIQYCMCVDGK